MHLDKEIEAAIAFYEQLKNVAGTVDATLAVHGDALKTKALKPLYALEKKMLRAEKRKVEDRRRQIHSIKTALFPFNGLQERIDNFMPYYAKWGKAFIDQLYLHSLSLEQQFVVLTEE